MAEGLTKRQREVLNTLERYIREEGYVPSYRQIGQAIGCSSLSTVHKHVHRLKDKGYLTLEDWQAASIQIVDQKLICCPECQHIFEVSAQNPMHEELKSRNGKRGKFSATIKRFGSKPAYRGLKLDGPFEGLEGQEFP